MKTNREDGPNFVRGWLSMQIVRDTGEREREGGVGETERKSWLFAGERALSRLYSNLLIALFAWRRGLHANRVPVNINERISCKISRRLNGRRWQKKDRGTSGVKLPHSKPPSSHLYLFLSVANMHYLCGKLRELELYKFRRESPLMSKACSIRSVFHRHSWLFPAKCIDNLIGKFAGIMNFMRPSRGI